MTCSTLGLLLDLVPRLSAATAWTLTALVAVVVLVGCRTVLTWGWSAVLCGLALLGPLPVALTGHSAGGGAHDLATDSLVGHVLAASLWIGGLVAVLAPRPRAAPTGRSALATAVPRFSRLALVCWLVTGRDRGGERAGAHPARRAVRLRLRRAGAGQGGCAAGPRRGRRRAPARTVPAAARGEPRALLRLGGIEVLLMLATIGLAVALGRTAPPDTGIVPSRTEAIIGYDLAGPPTLARLAFDWRFNLLFGTAALVLAAVYLLGVRRLRRRGDGWPIGRTLAWLAGCTGLLLATSSGLGRYGPAMFSVHMAQHMMLGMLVPILLVLGAPVTLALRALPPAGRNGPPGPREWLLAAVHSAPARWLTHPLVTLPLFVGQLLRAVLLRAVPGGVARALGAPADEPALPAGRAAVLLAPGRGRPGAAAAAARGAVGCGVRLGAVPRVLRGRPDERQLGDRRGLLPEPGPALGARSAA